MIEVSRLNVETEQLNDELTILRVELKEFIWRSVKFQTICFCVLAIVCYFIPSTLAVCIGIMVFLLPETIVLLSKKYRAISGLSMGGDGSFTYALHHPELFSSACPLSAGTGPLTLEDAKI